MSFLKLFAIVFAGFAFVLIALVVAVRVFLRRVRNSPEFKAEMARHAASRAAEETLVEQADWFGTTGLSDDDERELPRYLRREFGELVEDDGALQARDMRYLGRFDEQDGPVHYWRLPDRCDDGPVYAYVCTAGEGLFAWGDREPPARAPDALPREPAYVSP